MKNEWKIWTCPVCTMVMECSDEEQPHYCTGDGCGPFLSGFEPRRLYEGQHKSTLMEAISVRRI